MPPRLPARVIFLKIHQWNCYFCICKELGFLSQNKCVTFQIPVSKIFVLLFSSSLLIGFNNNHKKKYTRYGANFFFFLSEKYHAVAVASQPLRQFQSVQTLMSLVHGDPFEIIYIETAFMC